MKNSLLSPYDIASIIENKCSDIIKTDYSLLSTYDEILNKKINISASDPNNEATRLGGKDKDLAIPYLLPDKHPIEVDSSIFYRYHGGRDISFEFYAERERLKDFTPEGRTDNLIGLVFKENMDTRKIARLGDHIQSTVMTNEEMGDQDISRSKKYKLIIKNKEFFAISKTSVGGLDIKEDRWILITPYTGFNFCLLVKDNTSLIYRDLKDLLPVPSGTRNINSLQRLIYNSTQAGIIVGNNALFNKARLLFKNIQFDINRSISKEYNNITSKRRNFLFRPGDIIKYLPNAKDENWLILTRYFDKPGKRYLYIVLRYENDEKLKNISTNVSSIEENLAVQPTGISYDPIKDMIGENNYIKTIDENLLNIIKATATPLLQSISSHYKVIESFISYRGDDELPPINLDREKNINPDDIGNLIYLADGIPNQKIERYVQKIGTNKDEKDALERAAKIGKFDELVTKEIVDLEYPNSRGWYVIVNKNIVPGTDKKRYTLVPYPQKNIKVIVPYLRSDPKIPTRIIKEEKTEYVNYVIYDSSDFDEYTIKRLVSITNEGYKVKSIRNTPTFNQYEEYVNKFDIKGNEKTIVPGDIINYNNHLWYVANRKSRDDRFDNRFNRDEGNEVNFMLIPLISFINMKPEYYFNIPSTNRYEPGGNPGVGYGTYKFSKKGKGSLEEKANKAVSVENTKYTNILHLAIKYYSEYEQNGTPRLDPIIVKEDVFPQLHRDSSLITDRISQNIEPFADDLRMEIYEKGKSNPVVKDIDNKLLKNGMIIKYTWPDHTQTTEIFYEYLPEVKKIRLVPRSGFKGNKDGLVDVKGYAGVYEGDNIKNGDFWKNYYNNYYDIENTFEFPTDFEEDFSKLFLKPEKIMPTDEEVKQKNLDKEIKEDKDQIKKILNKTSKLETYDFVRYAEKFVKDLEPGRVVIYLKGTSSVSGDIVKSVIKNVNIDINNLKPSDKFSNITIFPDSENPSSESSSFINMQEIPLTNIFRIIPYNDPSVRPDLKFKDEGIDFPDFNMTRTEYNKKFQDKMKDKINSGNLIFNFNNQDDADIYEYYKEFFNIKLEV